MTATPPRPGPEHPWPHRTPRYRVLGLDLSFASDVERALRYLGELFAPFEATCVKPATPSPPPPVYAVADHGPGGIRYATYRDTHLLNQSDDLDNLFDHLLWHVYNDALASAGDVTLVHAATVASTGDAVTIVAPSGGGKTTLAAGLVERGFDYLTDEITVVCDGGRSIAPFPRALGLKSTSPLASRWRQDWWLGRQTYVPSRCVRADVRSVPARPALVVFPEFRPGAPGVVTPVGRADGLVRVARQAFRLSARGKADFVALANFATHVRFVECRFGDLATACSLVEESLRP